MLQRLEHGRVSSSAAYRGSLRGLNTFANKVAGTVQSGSLPVYLGVVLLTAAVVPGMLLVTIADPVPSLGPAYTLLAFIIVIIGGMGSMVGALVGGVLIGVSEALAGLLVAPSAKGMFSFGLLILVLLFRPQGLLGKRN